MNVMTDLNPSVESSAKSSTGCVVCDVFSFDELSDTAAINVAPYGIRRAKGDDVVDEPVTEWCSQPGDVDEANCCVNHEKLAALEENASPVVSLPENDGDGVFRVGVNLINWAPVAECIHCGARSVADVGARRAFLKHREDCPLFSARQQRDDEGETNN